MKKLDLLSSERIIYFSYLNSTGVDKQKSNIRINNRKWGKRWGKCHQVLSVYLSLHSFGHICIPLSALLLQAEWDIEK